ncbi:DUF2232 domain-containing protein [Gaopeijia maritima]|uniref:DUF2232 domain-containing protein n=1 Tax=Gaopeijia maritima TaxID=3119007 RepID=UPI003249E172
MTEDPATRPPATQRDRGEWKRAFALFLLLLAFSSVSPMILVGLPFALLVLLLPIRRFGALALAALVLMLAFGARDPSGLWYAERGWAVLLGGWFAGLTLRWPASRFTARGLGAAVGASVTAGVWFAVRPTAWAVLDWRIGERIRQGSSAAMQTMQLVRGGEPVPQNLADAVYTTAESQALLFPALVALTSFAALGVAWWMYVRVALGRVGALGPLKDFRFNDHLVWLFVAGLLTLLLGAGELWTRAGSNAVLFMGALYTLRGAAVLLFVNGGISALGIAVVTLGMLFLAPALIVGALVIGLGDTWLDIRARAARAAEADR